MLGPGFMKWKIHEASTSKESINFIGDMQHAQTIINLLSPSPRLNEEVKTPATAPSMPCIHYSEHGFFSSRKNLAFIVNRSSANNHGLTKLLVFPTFGFFIFG